MRSANRAVRLKQLALVSVCTALNLGIGFVVAALKLPFYLDSIGTVLATSLGGFGTGLATGVLAVLVGSLYTPTLWAYAPTAATIALFVFATHRLGYLHRLLPTVLWGLAMGFCTAIVSAPITAYVWGGVSLSGADAFTALFAATGKNLANAVVLGGLSTDPVDKLFTSLVAFLLLRRVPDSWKRLRGQ